MVPEVSAFYLLGSLLQNGQLPETIFISDNDINAGKSSYHVTRATRKQTLRSIFS